MQWVEGVVELPSVAVEGVCEGDELTWTRCLKAISGSLQALDLK